METLGITDEAVEAGAEALWEPGFDGDTYAGETAVFKDLLRRDAKLVLEAAAPHMLAGAWEAGRDEGYEAGRDRGAPEQHNPYRTAA